MEKEICSNCKYSQLVRFPVGEIYGGIHSSDNHVNMYICHHRRAQHYGHVLLGDHSCLGFKKSVDDKKLRVRKFARYA